MSAKLRTEDDVLGIGELELARAGVHAALLTALSVMDV